MLAGDQGLEKHELGDFAALTEKAAIGLAGNAGSERSGLAGEGLLAADVESLLQETESKKRKRRAVGMS